MSDDKKFEWEQLQQTWKELNIQKSDLVQALASADIIESHKIHHFNEHNDIQTALRYAIDFNKAQGSAIDYDYKEWYQNDNRFLDLWLWLGELVGLSIPADFAQENEDFDVYLNPPPKNNFYFFDEFIFSYKDKKYKFILYSHFIDKTIFIFAGLINTFLEIINHEKRLFALVDGDLDSDDMIALDLERFNSINAKIPLPVKLAKNYFEPLDISHQLELINPEYEQIIAQGYYISAINGEKVPVPKVYSPYQGIAKTYAEWLVEYSDIDPKTLVITKKSQLPHIEKLILNRLTTLENDTNLSQHEKLWELWTYSIYLRNLFIAIARYGVYDDKVTDYNYRYKPLWDVEKQQEIFNKLMEILSSKDTNLDLMNFFEQIKAIVFEKYQLMNQINYTSYK